MKNRSSFIVLLTLLITCNYAIAEVTSCAGHMDINIQASEKTELEQKKEIITTKTTQTKLTRKLKPKSGNYGMFKLLIPDMRNK